MGSTLENLEFILRSTRRQIEELEATEEMLIASQDYIKKCGAEEKKITQRLEGSK